MPELADFAAQNSGWLRICRLPTYAPELNPAEGIWSLLKRSIANFAAPGLDGPCDCGPIGFYEATAGLSACSHHWRKLVGVEFCGVRWTPLSRPSFFARAMSVYP